MNTTKRILLAAAIALGLAGSLVAEEQARYIVILKQRSGAAPDVASLGGTVESRQDEQLVVSIPAEAVGKLKADPRVLYLQRVGGDPTADEAPLIGVPPEPSAGVQASAHRLMPQPLGNTPWSSGTYSYDGAGNIIGIGSNIYVYDAAQRLKQSTTGGAAETYTYDGFGNMLTKTNTTMPVVVTATNRYQGYSYNDIGAVTSDGSYTFTYDALGQPLSKTYAGVPAENYIYTAGDERIGVQRGDWWTWSVRDEGGKVLRQYRSSATNLTAPSLWLEDFVWRDGLLLGSQRPTEMGGRRQFHLDHLGTPRLITSDSGQRVSMHDYYPFGVETTPVVQEGPGSGGFDREEPMKFTGHERDFAGGFGAEGGGYIDYMHARYYSSLTGRFLSVDPVLNVKRAMTRPQAWNRYAYVEGNPMNGTDPTGEAVALVAVNRMSGFERMMMGFEGSVDTAEDLGRWATGNLPPVSAGSPAEAANVRNTPGWQEIVDQFVANGYKQPVDANGKAVPIYSNYQYRQLVTTANGTGQLVGSFGAFIRSIGNGQYVVRAFNRWSLESGTRLPELPGAGSNRRNPSVQDMLTVKGTPIVWPRSVLNGRTTGAFATIQKNYLWIESIP